MALQPKPFHELLKMEFIIPPYQRGYRWDEEQVKALLDDLEDFINKNKKKNFQFNGNTDIYYCLQPIAVVREPQNDPNTDTYFVVDGQQRLTTVYLLLHYLKRLEALNYSCPTYSLHMPSRDSQEKYIQGCKFKEADDEKYIENIDNFYVRKAYEAIEEWFKDKADYMVPFRELFMHIEDKRLDVKVIWYEIKGATALDAFRRLNYGKIPLTSTELVKALLLQGDGDPSTGEHRRGAAYRRALEWDEMEHTLQNPYLWAMLAGQSEDLRSHLELILDFVADNLNEMMKNEKMEKPFVRKNQINKDSKDYFNYNVVNEFLRKKGESGIDDVWSKIRKVFNLIVNWYDNRKWYHLIGLLRILPKDRKKRREFVKDIYRLSVDDQNRPKSQSEFENALKEEIGKAVKKLPENTGLWELSYNEDKEHIIQILKLLNVKEAIDDNTEENRFAFHLFDAFNVTSLEHIHPQNITTDAKREDFRKWVEQRTEDFGKLTDLDLEKAVRNAKKTDESTDIEEQIKQIKERRKEVEDAIATLKKLSEKKEDYENENNQNDLQNAAKTLDTFFGDLSGIDESELHSISNMALVDQPTNSVLQNFFLDHKRDLLMKRHQECDISDLNKKKGTYAPPATRHVFCKEYSRNAPGDMRLWRKEDRENYFKAIEKAYYYFVNKQPYGTIQ